MGNNFVVKVSKCQSVAKSLVTSRFSENARVGNGVTDAGHPATAVGREAGGRKGVGGEEAEEPEAEASQGGGAGRDREVQEGERTTVRGARGQVRGFQGRRHEEDQRGHAGQGGADEQVRRGQQAGRYR